MASIEYAVQRLYKASRYDIVWRSMMSLPKYRYPTPFPVHNQAWSARDENGRSIVRALIGNTRHELRLTGGPGWRPQIRRFRQIVSGEAIGGEMALYERGGKIVCKLVAWFPRRPERELDGTLLLRTESKGCWSPWTPGPTA